MILTEEKLKKILKSNDVSEWFSIINSLLEKYNITTADRVACFLAQTCHESGDFKVLKENLNYSADGLNKVFPKYFKNAGRDATKYAKQPEKIANIIYANRMGNGDIASGDGYKFRGRGLIQLTGKSNYEAFAKSLNKSINETVQYLETKAGALESALWFWTKHNLNVLADKKDIKGLTLKINGGVHGLEDRTKRFNEYIKILA